jgi:hypothetical protein
MRSMVHRSVLRFAIVLGVLGVSSSAIAQQNTTPAAPAEGTTGGNAPASDPGEKKGPSTPAAGYAYGDKASASRSSGGTHARYRRIGPVVNIPGFEQTADGGSRLFVQLTQNVPVEERKAQGTITYVLKGASPRVWNNTNALVTVHFNTPVSRARLVPHGHDLHFIVELRSAATPTWKIAETADKSAMLTIDFPKGDFLGGAEPAHTAEEPAAKPPPRAARGAGKRGGRKPVPPPKQ